MPRAVHVATGTADVQGVNVASTLVGFSVRESGTVAAVATVIIRNGTSTAGTPVAFIELAADKAETHLLPSVDCPDGIFIDRVLGETELTLYTG